MNAELSQNQTKLLIDNFETLSETICYLLFKLQEPFMFSYFQKIIVVSQLGKIVLNYFHSVHFTSIHNNVTLL